MKRVEKFEGVLNGTVYTDKSAFVKALEQFRENGKEITEVRYGTTVTYEEDDNVLPNKQSGYIWSDADFVEYLFPDIASVNKAFDTIQEGTAEDSDKVFANIEKNMSDRLRYLVNNTLLAKANVEQIKDAAEEAAEESECNLKAFEDIRADILSDIEHLKNELHKTENCIKFASNYAGYVECIKEYMEDICK